MLLRTHHRLNFVATFDLKVAGSTPYHLAVLFSVFSDSSPGIMEAVNDTNFWIPSLPEITYIRDGVGLISVFCPKIIKENRPCGDGQVASR